MREWLIRLLWHTLPADRQFWLRLHHLKEPSLNDVLLSQSKRNRPGVGQSTTKDGEANE